MKKKGRGRAVQGTDALMSSAGDVVTDASTRPGRWRSGMESRRRILEASRSLFVRQGYRRATLRAIAAEAGVDPAMVHYFFGTKKRLFTSAMKATERPGSRLAPLIEMGLGDLGPRLVRQFLEAWDGGFEPLFSLARSTPDDEESASMLRIFLERDVRAPLARAIGGADADLRAGLAVTHLTGLAAARYLIGLEPIASATADELVLWLGPVLQRCLTIATPGSPAF